MSINYIDALERLLLLDEEMMNRRYEIFRHVQGERRVFYSEKLQRWIFTQYSDVREALRDARLSSEQLPSVLKQLPAEIRDTLDTDNPLLRQANKIMMSRDDPDHARLRLLVNKAFTPRMIEHQRPLITRLTHDLLDQMGQQEQPDFIRDLAIPLPIMVIAALIGIPYESLGQIKQWSDAGADFLGKPTDTLEVFFRMAGAAMEFNAFIHPHLEERRRQPKDDLLSAFIAAESQGDKLTEDELIANIYLLLAAGNETTTNLLGNGLYALLKHPDQLELLRQRPALADTAVEEILRYESPSQITGRHTKRELEIAGQQIGADQSIMLLLGMANRDPQVFTDPDRFDITRKDNKHIAFGLGPHYCLGAPLARLEAQVILPMVLERFPAIHLTDSQIHWRKNPTFLGPENLPVALS
ncbi:cytochrome P450 [Dictyobacter kobayashii]|uniref:Cytochrome P-450 like protein n=1 Tax=Dictyobacter kobayashii TaxID=2014872 RepID=A0A402AXY2_9CHLR|nr:cytochrome P450 [Dictyobacter kobayashii]GCE23935.1 cytochrome P-450 like protein [Dictyobacter kobayashii]